LQPETLPPEVFLSRVAASVCGRCGAKAAHREGVSFHKYIQTSSIQHTGQPQAGIKSMSTQYVFQSFFSCSSIVPQWLIEERLKNN
jgi:hypothetical protein